MPRGGARTGAGAKKGSKQKPSIFKQDREACLDRARKRILPRLDRIFDRHADNAEGVSYMLLRDDDGSYVRATDEKQFDAAIAAGKETFRIYTKEPSASSFKELMDRTFGKAPERVEVTGKDGEPLTILVKGKPW